MERPLRLGDVRRITFPGFEHGSLESASKGKTQFPRHAIQTIHCVGMFCGLQISLPAREKDKTWGSDGNHALHAAQSSFSYFLHRSLLRTIFSRKHHVRFQ